MVILGLFRYAAAYADIHTRLGRLLTSNDYEELLASQDLYSFIQYLKHTHYREALVDINLKNQRMGIKASQFERELRGHAARASQSYQTFLSGAPQELMAWRWRRFEIDNLKTVLRAVDRNVDPRKAQSSLIPLGDTSKLPWIAMLEAKEVEDVIDLLGDTFYNHVLSPALNRYTNEGSLLFLEVRLDLAYFQKLLKLIENLHGQDRKIAHDFLGSMINSQNILWALRYKTFYNLSPEEILNYSLLEGLEADAEVIQKIATGAHILPILQEIWNGELSGLEEIKTASSEKLVVKLEEIFNKYLYKKSQKMIKGYAMHLGIVLAFDFMLEAEIRDLISIAEGKIVGLSSKEIKSYLYRHT